MIAREFPPCWSRRERNGLRQQSCVYKRHGEIWDTSWHEASFISYQLCHHHWWRLIQNWNFSHLILKGKRAASGRDGSWTRWLFKVPSNWTTFFYIYDRTNLKIESWFMLSDPGSLRHRTLQSLLKLFELLVTLQSCGFPPTLYKIKSLPFPRDQL